ncbi:MAG: hypothetical protein ACI8V4_001718, partial [Ilumatobacter sp.]
MRHDDVGHMNVAGGREATVMQQLSGLDASFLYMETPNTYGH